MKLKKIDHIGILVKDLEKAIKFYRDKLGLHVESIESSAEFEVRVAFLPIGEVMIELVAPFKGSPIDMLIDEKGEGLHHIAVEVDDIRKSLKELSVLEVPLVDTEPRMGGEGALVAFLDAAAANNVAIELKEKAKKG